MNAVDPLTARIAVVGPGAVGTFFAAQLASSGRNVVACARRRFDRYRIDSATAPVDAPATCVIDPAELPAVGLDAPADLVIVTVKGFQTAGAAPWFDALCGPSTIVAGAQNGVEEVERLTPFVHGARVVPCVVYCGTELLEPGHVRHDQSESLIVPDDDVSAAVAPIFEATPVEWRIDPAFVTETWRKLGLNTAFNGITGLTRRRMDALAEPPLAELTRDVLREAWTVGRAEGAAIDPDDADSIDLKQLPAQGTSMYYDVMADRPTEYDELHGAVVRIGERHGIDTPLHSLLHTMLGALPAEHRS